VVMSLQVTLLLAGVAFVAGTVDAIAGGGGLFTLPALLAAGLPPHIALGTNKGQSVFGATASFVSFFRSGKIDLTRLKVAFTFGLVGSILGALALLAMRPEPLRPIIIVLLVAAALVVVLRGHVKVSLQPKNITHPKMIVACIAIVFGAYDGFFGPGVGSMLIVAFVIFFGDSLIIASANAKVVNLASNLAAVVIFAIRGTVLWKISLPMAIGNALGASFGARLAIKRGDRFVRIVILVVVGLLVAKLTHDFVRSK
jgi:uncharacterized membrane protein YfcA